MLEKEISPTEILQLHIEERKVERLGARRRFKYLFLLEENSLRSLERQRNFSFKVLKKKNSILKR